MSVNTKTQITKDKKLMFINKIQCYTNEQTNKRTNEQTKMEIEGILLIMIISLLSTAAICMSYPYLCNAQTITQVKIIPCSGSPNAETDSPSSVDLTV